MESDYDVVLRHRRRMFEDMGNREGLRFLFLPASDEGKPLYEELGFVSTDEMRLEL